MALDGGQSARADTPRLLHSPDGRLVVEIAMPLSGSHETPRWSASFRGKLLLSECRLSLDVAGEGDLLAGVVVQSERRRSADRRMRVLFGKADYARDHYRETRFSLENPHHRHIEVVFRCYD